MKVLLQGEYGDPESRDAELSENTIEAYIRTAKTLEVYQRSYRVNDKWVYRYVRSEPLPAA